MSKASTGCPILDKAGVGVGMLYKGVDLCLNCPYPECIMVDKENDLKWKSLEIKEICLRCKKCGAMETVMLIEGRLQKTQKWLQKGDTFYHAMNCGVAEEIRMKE